MLWLPSRIHTTHNPKTPIYRILSAGSEENDKAPMPEAGNHEIYLLVLQGTRYHDGQLKHDFYSLKIPALRDIAYFTSIYLTSSCRESRIPITESRPPKHNA